ncbi:aldolase/citrate lyase family protein [Paracraurococcus lichenis]|uniref:Aldolase/citrate lyase family protein n=1 Tax=Paracraurococcus lichenis TaxID=3064888 RepID=A0ABT9DS55_9PROT|nr:aldolase/citrate lyase family protein [Paracraurococcus sp. LOR1-02]MDO9706724.1 aldolase/citrate lyase family protein [Paracraurococcus sp. LOR1-02]
MNGRINRAIALLQQDQAIYYTGHHTGHVLTEAAGREDAATWADYINIGMEHGAFDVAGLAAYMQGLVAGGPTRTGHRTPAVIVEAPVNGTDEANVRHNAWQFRQILGRGVHGVLLCQAESGDAVRAFVESCRYPHQAAGVDPGLPSPLDRMGGAAPTRPGPGRLGTGTRGRGSEATAAPIWSVEEQEYFRLCDPWPLNPEGALLLGVKIESPEGVARCEEILSVPGIGFAEMGPGDLGLSLLGRTRLQLSPYPPEMQAARDRVFAACRARGIAFLEHCTPETIAARLDEGVRVISGGREDTARVGRAHQRRAMPV